MSNAKICGCGKCGNKTAASAETGAQVNALSPRGFTYRQAVNYRQPVTYRGIEAPVTYRGIEAPVTYRGIEAPVTARSAAMPMAPRLLGRTPSWISKVEWDGIAKKGGRDVMDLPSGERDQVVSLIAYGTNPKQLCEIAQIYTNRGDLSVAARIVGASKGLAVHQYVSETGDSPIALPEALTKATYQSLFGFAKVLRGDAARMTGSRARATEMFAERVENIAYNLREVALGRGVACSSSRTSNKQPMPWR